MIAARWTRSWAAPLLGGWLGLLLGSALLPATAWAGNGQLELAVVDREGGPPLACRMKLINGQGRVMRPRKVPFFHDYLLLAGRTKLQLPSGQYGFEIERGPEYPILYGKFEIKDFADDSKTVVLKRHVHMAGGGWWSGDLEVRRPVADVPALMQAEDLHLAQVVTWWNAKNDWVGRVLPNPIPGVVDQSRFYQQVAGGFARPGGAFLLLNLSKPLALPEGNDETPTTFDLLEAARKNHAWVDVTRAYAWDLPTLVALGQVDSVQLAYSQMTPEKLVGTEIDGRARDRRRYPDPWGNAQWSQDIYFHLLNCGLRLPPSAGSGSGLVPNPPGYDRMYVHADGPLTYERWWEGFRAGRVVVTNGPLLQPSVQGELPGAVFVVDSGAPLELEIGLTLSTREPISYLEIIQDGRVAHAVRFEEYARSGTLPKVVFRKSGWFLIRVLTDQQKTYRFAITAPYYVQIGPQRRISKASAQFFVDWITERARQLKIDDPAARQAALEPQRKARDFWQKLVDTANAD